VRRAGWVVALAAAPLASAASAQTERPSLAQAVADPGALAAFLSDCAGRLTKNDVGLARVARVCPGIDFAIAHGPLAEALRYRAWPRDLDQERLRLLARLADTGVPRAQITLDPAQLKAELDRLNVRESEHRNWWQRLLDRVDRWLSAGSSSVKLPDWLRGWLDRLHVSADGPRWILAIMTALPVAVIVVALIYGLRRGGILRRRLERRSRRQDEPGVRGVAPAAAPGPASLAERFAALLARLESRGLIPNARALTCRELARATVGRADLEVLGPIAGTVEKLRYGFAAPAADVIENAQSRLEALALTQGLHP
jgi:hypothetical protein